MKKEIKQFKTKLYQELESVDFMVKDYFTIEETVKEMQKLTLQVKGLDMYLALLEQGYNRKKVDKKMVKIYKKVQKETELWS